MSHIPMPHPNLPSDTRQLHAAAARKNTIIHAGMHQIDTRLCYILGKALDRLSDEDLKALLHEWIFIRGSVDEATHHFSLCRHAQRYADARREYLLALEQMNAAGQHMKSLSRMLADVSR